MEQVETSVAICLNYKASWSLLWLHLQDCIVQIDLDGSEDIRTTTDRKFSHVMKNGNIRVTQTDWRKFIQAIQAS
jgi:hypothetical protein